MSNKKYAHGASMGLSVF